MKITAAARYLHPGWSTAAGVFCAFSVLAMHTAAGPWLLGTGLTLFVLNTGQAVIRARRMQRCRHHGRPR